MIQTELLYNKESENSYSITHKERQALWDRTFDEYMQKPKEELVKFIIGERPI